MPRIESSPAIAGPVTTLQQVGDAMHDVGVAAWEHKADIGAWVGTAALVLGLPIRAGASSARLGSLLAARGATLTARVAGAGRFGATAAQAARAGAATIRSSAAKLAATPAGTATTSAMRQLQAGRISFGTTTAGKAMIAAQQPVTAAATVLAGVNFADTTRRFVEGDASPKELALSTLGFVPVGLGGIQRLAAARAASAGKQAATAVTSGLENVEAHAAGATDDASHVARLAPATQAHRTAGAAASAHADAVDTVEHAGRLKALAAGGAARSAEPAVSATTLVAELDQVSLRASAGRLHAEAAERLAPAALVPAARAARAQLDQAVIATDRIRTDIAGLAQSQQQAERVAGQAEVVKDVVGSTAMHAGIINNGMLATREPSNHGVTLADAGLVRGITSWLLGRNARMPVGSLGAANGAAP